MWRMEKVAGGQERSDVARGTCMLNCICCLGSFKSANRKGSNVDKSSLLNSLTRQLVVLRTSEKPRNLVPLRCHILRLSQHLCSSTAFAKLFERCLDVPFGSDNLA